MVFVRVRFSQAHCTTRFTFTIYKRGQMKVGRAKKQLQPLGWNIKKHAGLWLVYPIGEKSKAVSFKSQHDALRHAKENGVGEAKESAR